MAIDMSQFYQVFFEESEEHLAAMEALLLDLNVESPDMEQLNAIFRAAHSIKGSAGTFGFTDLAETTHILENLLDRIRKFELGLRPEMVDAFLGAGDLLRSMLEAHQGRGVVDPIAVEAISNRLRLLSSESGDSVQESAVMPGLQVETPSCRVFDIQFVPTEVSVEAGGVENLIEELRTLGQLEILNRPDGEPAGVGFWELRLTSPHGAERFNEQIDFVADNGAWRISEEQASAGDGETAFGFFHDNPGAPEEDPSYGFFAPVNVVDSPAQEDGEAYGFFDPLPAPATPAVAPSEESGSGIFAPVNVLPDSSSVYLEEGDGFGFFVPVTTINAAREPTVSEEGEGYGFFTPLPSVEAKPIVKSEEANKVTSKPVHASERQSVGIRNGPSAVSDSSIRVSVEKVDQLINLVGELVITQAMLIQTTSQMQDSVPERLVNGLAQLERNTRDLQESVMSIRMLPISFVFSRFPRVVRDLSAKLGKQVELKTLGETTELDKGLIERIADPLTHLIRNSLDHGIELPEKRIASGKSPVGTITLKAYHQGGNIVIEVGDDGAGLPRQKILAKAKERGLQVSEQMSDSEVFNLIFEAGFSTAEEVTDVSGRGVGMDVVRRNIQAMGGRVEIESMLGVGTRMTVRLPLTLAILDGMSIAVADQTYILPLSYVIESLQPEAGDIKTLSNQARVMRVRGEYLPVVVLHEVFNLRSGPVDFTQGIMVVLDADGAKAALFVDALLGQHQVVIKSLEANYRRVHGISGATIMGDGHVALILDVSAIAGMARTIMQKQAEG
ncbi:MAG: chemotaxis protein CheA [Rhodocyclales bacterium GT-UBC]|nr:MAG: chemotaxis protein CheA [Rhodocyclales bacterium GT-UBC]